MARACRGCVRSVPAAPPRATAWFAVRPSPRRARRLLAPRRAATAGIDGGAEPHSPLALLRGEEVHTWWLFPAQALPLDSGQRDAYLSVLDAGEAERYHAGCAAGSGEAQRRADEWLLSRLLLRWAVARCCPGGGVLPNELTFAQNEHGKPHLAAVAGVEARKAVEFNLTHSASIIGCAVASKGRQVGLDAEANDRQVRAGPLSIARRRFSPAEVCELEETLRADGEASARQRFVDLWTLKEAYVKATGRGISAPPGLKGFSVGVTPQEGHVAKDWRVSLAPAHGPEPSGRLTFESQLPGDEKRWALALLQPSAEHTAAVCVEAPAPEQVRLRMFQAHLQPKEALFRQTELPAAALRASS